MELAGSTKRARGEERSKDKKGWSPNERQDLIFETIKINKKKNGPESSTSMRNDIDESQN